MYNIDVKDKVVVITGGSSGIGLTLLKAFLENGSLVCNWDINKSNEVINLESSYPDRLHTLITDVTSEENIKSSTQRSIELFGKINILVNNAGIISKSTIEDSDLDAFQKLYDVNIKGTVLTAKYLTPYLKKSEKGRILNMSSIQAVIGMETYSPYTFTKAAVSGLTRVWALELAPFGITVNAICPGWVDTPMKNGLIKKISSLHNISETEAQQKILSYVPQKRFIQPEEVAFTALFLSSPMAQGISGMEMFIDTGLTATCKPGLHTN